MVRLKKKKCGASLDAHPLQGVGGGFTIAPQGTSHYHESPR